MGGAFVVSRSNRPQPATATAGAGAIDVQTAQAEFVEPAAPRNRQAMLLEAMKEELFQLELDRQQGNITAEEYTKAKAALDETIKRAIARSKS